VFSSRNCNLSIENLTSKFLEHKKISQGLNVNVFETHHAIGVALARLNYYLTPKGVVMPPNDE
jgi:hypothetical protein